MQRLLSVHHGRSTITLDHYPGDQPLYSLVQRTPCKSGGEATSCPAMSPGEARQVAEAILRHIEGDGAVQKEKAQVIASRKMEPCEATDCRYCKGGRCAFGLRDTGCYLTPEIKELAHSIIQGLEGDV